MSSHPSRLADANLYQHGKPALGAEGSEDDWCQADWGDVWVDGAEG